MPYGQTGRKRSFSVVGLQQAEQSGIRAQLWTSSDLQRARVTQGLTFSLCKAGRVRNIHWSGCGEDLLITYKTQSVSEDAPVGWMTVHLGCRMQDAGQPSVGQTAKETE